MPKVITFSRTFPAYHPKAGQPTHFVEKLIESFLALGEVEITDEQLHLCNFNVMRPDVWEKWHTIRSGNRWKAGDKFSPRVWSGKPYNSKMITIAPDITIEKVWDFEIYETAFLVNDELVSAKTLNMIAINDGLSLSDLTDWFKFPNDFKGQIICWNKNISY